MSDLVELSNDDADDYDVDPTKLNGESAWSYMNNHYYASEHTTKHLPVGTYVAQFTNQGLGLMPKKVVGDDLLVLPDSASEDVLENIEFFWTQKNVFHELGFLWKRGILLWGPPGSGKTSTLALLCKQLFQKGGMALYVVSPDATAQALSRIRTIEPERPIIVLMEDIDTIIRKEGESEILAMLDGEHQVDNVVFVATTNYPEQLDKRLTNRPSRFDIVKKIGLPTSAARDVFLKEKNPSLTPEHREIWVENTQGYSIAHLKELIILVEIFNDSFENAKHKLDDLIKDTIEDDDGISKRFGFIPDDEID